tara:strand:+ start:757 stop:1059 length:303 start_codon:yes stop_codon:yes gene_type:complete
MNFDHVAINVRDMEKSVNWYTAKFKAETLYRDDTWSMLKLGDIKIALVLSSSHPPHFAFRVDSVDKIPSNEMYVHRDASIYSYIEDPDGNVLEVLCYSTE